MKGAAIDQGNRGFAVAEGLLLLLPFVLFLQFFLMFRGLLAELSFLLYAAERIVLPGLALGALFAGRYLRSLGKRTERNDT